MTELSPTAAGEPEQGLLGRWVVSFLLRLDTRKAHAKFWRPQLLCLLPPAASRESISARSAGGCQQPQPQRPPPPNGVHNANARLAGQARCLRRSRLTAD